MEIQKTYLQQAWQLLSNNKILWGLALLFGVLSSFDRPIDLLSLPVELGLVYAVYYLVQGKKVGILESLVGGFAYILKYFVINLFFNFIIFLGIGFFVAIRMLVREISSSSTVISIVSGISNGGMIMMIIGAGFLHIIVGISVRYLMLLNTSFAEAISKGLAFFLTHWRRMLFIVIIGVIAFGINYLSNPFETTNNATILFQPINLLINSSIVVFQSIALTIYFLLNEKQLNETEPI